MSTPSQRPLRLARGLVAATLLLISVIPVLSGCSRREAAADPASLENSSFVMRALGTSPWDADRPGLGEFGGHGWQRFPLAVGNHWDYLIRNRMVITTDQGPQPPTLTEEPASAEVTDTRHIGDRDYFLYVETSSGSGGNAQIQSTFPTRQDRSGLFQLDALEVVTPAATVAAPAGASRLAQDLSAYVDRALAGSPQRAAFQRSAQAFAARVESMRQAVFGRMPGHPGGPDPGELSLLRYPLHVGAEWDVRLSPHFTRTVVGRELLRLPAGMFPSWRLRGDSELFGPTDRVHFWYASAGLVKMSLHAEGEATDDAGNIIGHFVADMEQVLTDVHVSGQRGVGSLAASGSTPAGNE